MTQSQMARMPCVVKAIALAIFTVNVAAADEPRMLEVSASSVALQVAVAIEPGSVVGQRGIAQATSLGLIELDARGATIGSAIAVQLVPAATAEGKKSDGGRQLLAIMPPGASAKGTRRFRLQAATARRLSF